MKFGRNGCLYSGAAIAMIVQCTGEWCNWQHASFWYWYLGFESLLPSYAAACSAQLRYTVGAALWQHRAPMSDAIALRNRFAMAKGAWEEHLRDTPFPALGEGTAEQKIERLEMALIDEMLNRATPETAEMAADGMWGIVHARPDTDPVKQLVERHHETLARLGHRGLG